jgi:diguanylate cyclase (GGDEF)-like protein
MEPDVRTLHLLNVFVALFSAGASLTGWLDHRNVPGLRTWAIGLCLSALGAMMLALCPGESSQPFTIASGAMIVGGYVALWMGVRQFNGVRLDPSYAVVLIAVLLALAAASLCSGGDARSGSVFAAAMMAAFALLTASGIIRGRRHDGLRSRLPAGFAFLAVAANMILRTAALLDLLNDPGQGARLFVDTLCLLTIVFGLLTMAHERLRRRFEELALTDPLTGLPNRRCFFERAEWLSRHAMDNRLPAAVLMMDLDHFSKINQRFGHHGGDRALAAFAAAVRAELRAHDLVGRYGGEEFCALLCGADDQEARRIAERLRSAVAALSIDVDGQTLRFTVSIGAAPLADVDLPAAMRRADAALYRAKGRGRNRVCSVCEPDAGYEGELAVAPLSNAAASVVAGRMTGRRAAVKRRRASARSA